MDARGYGYCDAVQKRAFGYSATAPDLLPLSDYAEGFNAGTRALENNAYLAKLGGSHSHV